MIKIVQLDVTGFTYAMRAMRNPKNSWAKSDSLRLTADVPQIGEADMHLMQTLAHAGVEHRTFGRFIQVYVDVTAPIYWWKEADRYRVGKEQISTSTMHKLTSKKFERADFAIDFADPQIESPSDEFEALEMRELENDFEGVFNYVLRSLERWREEYILTGKRLQSDRKIKTLSDKERKHLERKQKYLWRRMIQTLPESYMQTRTLMLSYETLYKMYCERRNHKLTEWRTFCDWIEELPYFKEIYLTKEVS